jgi:hypothetical protein
LDAIVPAEKRRKELDGGRGGYLIGDLKPGDTAPALTARNRTTDEGWPTTWIRPDQPPLPLPIRFDEVSDGIYVDFLDKYLLNGYDTSGSSATNSHLNGGWKRPYEYTPFRLLGKDGSLQEIPYPQFIFDYGIADCKGNCLNFRRFLVTRPGIVIQKVRERSSALYLFKEGRLYLIAGGATERDARRAAIPADGIQTTRLSPNGCRLAYSHLERPEYESRYGAPVFFGIIDLCGSEK